MNVLVTGGAGYIGTHVCKALYKSGFDPFVYDNLSRGNGDLVLYGKMLYGHLLDEKYLEFIFDRYSIEAVVHLAGYAYVEESMSNPSMYYENNVSGTISLLKTMMKKDVEILIFSSSCTVYKPAPYPLKESYHTIPYSPYGKSKLMCERIIDDHRSIKNITLRYFNAAGADPDNQIGERHNPEPHLIPSLIKSILNHEPLSIYGKTYPTEDGTCVRDFVHVSDIADAHVLALKILSNEPTAKSITGEKFNLGSDKGYSIKEIVEVAQKIFDIPIEVKYHNGRAGDEPILISRSDKAKHILGWTPKFNTIESIIETAYNWHLKDYLQIKEDLP